MLDDDDHTYHLTLLFHTVPLRGEWLSSSFVSSPSAQASSVIGPSGTAVQRKPRKRSSRSHRGAHENGEATEDLVGCVSYKSKGSVVASSVVGEHWRCCSAALELGCCSRCMPRRFKSQGHDWEPHPRIKYLPRRHGPHNDRSPTFYRFQTC